MGAKVVGVSVDSIFAQAAWAKENGLKFPLASDYRREVVDAYGVLLPNFVGMGPSSERAVFVIDGSGVIRYVEVAPTPGDKVNLAAAKEAVASLGSVANS
ncbi:MAG: thiol peroxidase [Fimbriimonadaceae bacterium]|nr:thiol peroxidase [Fimbriimonadaceae bacterium]